MGKIWNRSKSEIWLESVKILSKVFKISGNLLSNEKILKQFLRYRELGGGIFYYFEEIGGNLPEIVKKIRRNSEIF